MTLTQHISKKEEERYAELQRFALDLARQGETAQLENMLEAGMPVNLADEKGQTLLMLAAYNGNDETCRLLIKFGADVDRRNDRGQTPLGGVAFKGYSDIAKLLIEAWADVHANNGGGLTPIHYAAMFGRKETVNLLKKYGARLETPATDSPKNGLAVRLARLVGKVRG